MSVTRREARNHALQILFQLDLNGKITPEQAVERFNACFNESGQQLDPYTERVVIGVFEKMKELDERIGGVSENWKPRRMPAVDRAILRLAAYEIFFCEDIPATVSVNEAIELSKVFGSEQSASFVNGVLDKLKLNSEEG